MEAIQLAAGDNDRVIASCKASKRLGSGPINGGVARQRAR